MSLHEISELLEVARDGYLFDLGESFERANVHSANATGDTLLHVAAARGCVSEIEYLLKCGLDINALGDYKATALHCAARMQHRHAFQKLLEFGANPQIRDSTGV